MTRRNLPNQVHSWLRHASKVGRLGVTHDVHVEEAGTLEKEVIVQRGHFQPIVQERRHYRVHLILSQHKVAHHDVHTSVTLGHGQPAAESEGGGRGHAVDNHVQVLPRNVDLQDVCLEIPLFAQDLQHFLILGGHLLGRSAETQTQNT